MNTLLITLLILQLLLTVVIYLELRHVRNKVGSRSLFNAIITGGIMAFIGNALRKSAGNDELKMTIEKSEPPLTGTPLTGEQSN